MSTTTFTIPRRQLADILSRIADTARVKIKPILQDVKISVTDDGKVSFYATDLERYHTETCEVNEWTGPPIEVCVNAKHIRKAVTSSKLKEIVVSICEEWVQIDGTLIPLGHSAQDMPTAPDVEHEYIRSPPVTHLLRLFTHTMYACDVDTTRYSMGGCFVEMDRPTTEYAFPDYLRFVATNGKRLATDYVGMQGPTELVTAIIPLAACKSAVKVLRKAESCALSLTADFAHVMLDVRGKDGTETQCVFRLIGERVKTDEGEWKWFPSRFPKWRDVIPNGLDSVCVIKADELAGLITQAKQCTSCESRAAQIDIVGGLLCVSTGATEIGRFEGKIQVEPSRDRALLTTKLDCQFVLDVAKACKGVDLEISSSDPLSIVRFDSSDGSTHLIMPLSDKPRKNK